MDDLRLAAFDAPVATPLLAALAAGGRLLRDAPFEALDLTPLEDFLVLTDAPLLPLVVFALLLVTRLLLAAVFLVVALSDLSLAALLAFARLVLPAVPELLTALAGAAPWGAPFFAGLFFAALVADLAVLDDLANDALADVPWAPEGAFFLELDLTRLVPGLAFAAVLAEVLGVFLLVVREGLPVLLEGIIYLWPRPTRRWALRAS